MILKKILIVDDDPEALKLIRLFLRRTGYDSITAVDGKSGLDTARKELPSLILLDLVMPLFNGYQFLEALLESPETESIPVITLSGKGSSEEKIKAKHAGASAYLEKPFHPQELLDLIQKTLE